MAPPAFPRFAAWALGGLFAGSILLGVFARVLATESEVFRFIALLIIFITALSASAVVFVGLRMEQKGEAFGLPGGSVRALLAIGIMILFVVFGLPLVSPNQEVLSSEAVSLPAEQLPAMIRINKEQGWEVRVLDPGTAGGRATAEIVRISAPSAAQIDLNEQMLTAIITLLTTVIGFYFGSRSATDGVKAETAAVRAANRNVASPAQQNPAAAPPPPGPPPPPPSPL